MIVLHAQSWENTLIKHTSSVSLGNTHREILNFTPISLSFDPSRFVSKGILTISPNSEYEVFIPSCKAETEFQIHGGGETQACGHLKQLHTRD